MLRIVTKKTKNKKLTTVEYIGWVGVGLLLINYVLLSAGIIEGSTIEYHGGSLIGSFCVAFEAWKKRDRQPAILNMVFVGVAVFALVRIIMTT